MRSNNANGNGRPSGYSMLSYINSPHKNSGLVPSSTYQQEERGGAGRDGGESGHAAPTGSKDCVQDVQTKLVSQLFDQWLPAFTEFSRQLAETTSELSRSRMHNEQLTKLLTDTRAQLDSLRDDLQRTKTAEQDRGHKAASPPFKPASALEDWRAVQESLQEVATSLREFRQWLPAVLTSSVNNTLQTLLTTFTSAATASMSHPPAPQVPAWSTSYQPDPFMTADGSQGAAQLALVMNALQQSQRLPPPASLLPVPPPAGLTPVPPPTGLPPVPPPTGLPPVPPPTLPAFPPASRIGSQVPSQGMLFGADMIRNASIFNPSTLTTSATPTSVTGSLDSQSQSSPNNKTFDFGRSPTVATVQSPVTSLFNKSVISPQKEPVTVKPTQSSAQKPLFNFQTIPGGVFPRKEAPAATASAARPSFPTSEESLSSMKSPPFSFNPLQLDTESKKLTPPANIGGDNKKTEPVAADDEDQPEAYVPQADFAPLVEKLPDLVTASTGEEQEMRVFCQRARLFRWDKPNNEWKARGVGELKVLEDANEVKFRIVMRRDQVMKLCANHYIAPGINFNRHPQNLKACMWSALDFANMDPDAASPDGTNELFMGQFRTEEIVNEFEKIVVDCLAKIETKSAKVSTEKSKPIVKEEETKQAPMTLLSGPKPGSWDCDGCALQVSPDLIICPACKTAKPGLERPAEEKKQVPMTLLSGPKPGSWDCDVCALQVSPDLFVCPACKTAKPGLEIPAISDNLPSIFKTVTSTSSQNTFSFGVSGVSKETSLGFDKLKAKQESGNSKTCALQVAPDKTVCQVTKSGSEEPEKTCVFKTSTPNTDPPKNTFMFGMPTGLPNTMFPFGSATTQAKSVLNTSKAHTFDNSPPTSQPSKLTGAFASVNLGTGLTLGKPNFSFTLNPATTTPKLVSSPVKPQINLSDIDLDEDVDKVEQADQSQLNFAPIIETLPEKVIVKTGEEDEEIVFDARAKLYRYLPADGWKERGVGQLKLLRTPSTKMVRVVMRRDQVLKVCCNHVITREMKLEPQSGGNDVPRWIWWGVDFAEEAVGVKETFSVRFKTTEDSQAFHDAFMDAAHLASGGTPQANVSTKEATAVPEADEVTSDEDDLVIVDQTSMSPDQVSRARALQLPDDFYAFETHPESRQRHREELTTDEEAAEDALLDAAVGMTKNSLNIPVSVISLSNTPETSSRFEDEDENKNVLPIGMDRSKAKTGSRECETCVLQTGADANKYPACQIEKPVLKENSEDAQKFPLMDFASLCSRGEESSPIGRTWGSAFSSKPHAWSGAGTSLFSQSSFAATAAGDDKPSDANEVDPDPHFEPIIPLPSIVETKTGEEDEVCLFIRRCRLYKMVGEVWKERGVGEMKIMAQPKTAAPSHLCNEREALSLTATTEVGGLNYARLLMRRDQVLKICANNIISQEVPDFKPLETSDTSLCWIAHDYSEQDKGEIMKLAMRFKNEQDVKDFLASIARTREMLKMD